MQKVSISFVTYVHQSAQNNLAPTGWIFTKFYIWVFLKNLSWKLKVSVISDKNNGYFTRSAIYIFDHISLNSSLNKECFWQQLYRKSIHTFHVQELVFKNCAIHEIIWKYIVEPERPQMTIWGIHISHWISKARNPHFWSM
jgi:hypothetical protein